MPVKEFFASAGIQIDAINYDSTIDCRDRPASSSRSCADSYPAASAGVATPRHPRYRTTGLRLNVDLQYSNRIGEFDPTQPTSMAPIWHDDVDTFINVTAENSGYAAMRACACACACACMCVCVRRWAATHARLP